MNAQTTYTKTAAGHDVILHRTRDMTLQERRVLIMVDGKRTVQELLDALHASPEAISILSTLETAGYIIPTGQTVHSGNTSPRPSNPTPTPTPQTQGLVEHTKEILRQELTEFMGPLAPFICDEVCSKVTNLEAALNALSNELGDPAKAARFRQSVMKRLS